MANDITHQSFYYSIFTSSWRYLLWMKHSQFNCLLVPHTSTADETTSSVESNTGTYHYLDA